MAESTFPSLCWSSQHSLDYSAMQVLGAHLHVHWHHCCWSRMWRHVCCSISQRGHMSLHCWLPFTGSQRAPQIKFKPLIFAYLSHRLAHRSGHIYPNSIIQVDYPPPFDHNIPPINDSFQSLLSLMSLISAQIFNFYLTFPFNLVVHGFWLPECCVL